MRWPLLLAFAPVLTACPRTARVKPAARIVKQLPRVLEGFRLGTSLGDLLDELHVGGWSTTVRWRTRGKVPIQEVRASVRDHPIVRRVVLRFAQENLISARVYYRQSDSWRASRLRRLCGGHAGIRRGYNRMSCVDQERRVLLSWRRNGVEATIGDVPRMIASGLLRKKQLERDIARGPQRTGTLPVRRTSRPLPTRIESLRLGMSVRTVLARFRAPRWRRLVRKRRFRGTELTRLTLTSRSAPVFRRLRLHFHRRRLIAARVFYRQSSYVRGTTQRRLCQGQQILRKTSWYVVCRDDWKAMWKAYKSGRIAELVDLNAALSAGLVRRQDLSGRNLRWYLP